MVLFGTKEVAVAGEEDEEKKISVIELVSEELINDDLSFENEQYRIIYDLFLQGLEDNVLLTASYFKKLEDQKIVSFVSNLESNEIELSYNWIQKYNIYTKSESDNIYKSVMNSIYNFKYHKVDALILKIKNEIKEGNNGDDELLNLLGEQMSYERIKKKLSDKLGRIILK
jgi:DNA primase